MAIKQLRLMADFETTTDPADCRVWAVCAVDIDTQKVAYLDTDIEGFMEWLMDKNCKVWFHNLKFDAEWLLHYLLTHGYKWDPGVDSEGNKTPFKEKTFRTLITDAGLFYSLEVCYKRINGKKLLKTTFYDSYKKLPFKVAEIARAFKLKISKGEIDYRADRPRGYQLTEEEKDYIVRDCQIVAEALKIQLDQGLKKMTNASDALSGYKDIIGRNFEYWFPVLPVELDDDLRRAYKGGFVYLNPIHKNRRGLQGLTLDVNSLYPSVMYDRLLPYGYPVYFEGAPEPDDRYPLYIVHLKCCFELKPGHIPTLQLKKNPRVVETEYLTTSRVKMGKGRKKYEDNEPLEMWLTNVDFDLFMEHYEVDPDKLTFINGFKFKGARGMFKEYIDYWMHIKETSKGAIRTLAKLQLNSLYGKFATSVRGSKKIPWLDDTGTVRYKFTEEETRDPVYTPMGCFITAYAREKTIRSAQTVYDRFIYADTDSLHLIGQEEPVGLEIHPTHLGAWKNEGVFDDSKYIRAKTYMETMHETVKDNLANFAKAMNVADSLDRIERRPDSIHYWKTTVTCAGMPDNVKELVTYENFEPGTTFDGKLRPKRYPGGIILEDSTFTIK